MAEWTVSTKEKKSVEEHEIWVKDGSTLTVKTGFRWGSWKVTTEDDRQPVFPDEEFNIYDTEYDVELINLDDGCWVEIEFSDDIDQEERTRLEILIEDESTGVLADEGWSMYDGECWVWCDLEITE